MLTIARCFRVPSLPVALAAAWLAWGSLGARCVGWALRGVGAWVARRDREVSQ